MAAVLDEYLEEMEVERFNKNTILLELAEQDNGDAILQILAHDHYKTVNIQQRTNYGDTALHIAAARGNMQALNALLTVRAKVDALGCGQRTPLHYAVVHGNLRIVQRLLIAGAQSDVSDAYGKTPFTLATEKEDADMVEFLIVNGEHPNERIASMAVSKNKWNLLKLCLENGVSIDAFNKEGDSLLIQAAKAELWTMLQNLLKEGASASKCTNINKCALVYAARAGQADIVRQLLYRVAKLDSNQVEVGLCAAKDHNVVSAFLDVVPDTVRGEVGGRAVCCAAKDGRLEALKALLDIGARVDVKLNSRSALWIAASYGKKKCVKELLRRNAYKDDTDKDGNTPLHGASMFGKVKCVCTLVEAGASVSERNNEGKTPFDVANSVPIKEVLDLVALH